MAAQAKTGTVLIGGSPDARQQIDWASADKHIAALVAPAPAKPAV